MFRFTRSLSVILSGSLVLSSLSPALALSSSFALTLSGSNHWAYARITEEALAASPVAAAGLSGSVPSFHAHVINMETAARTPPTVRAPARPPRLGLVGMPGAGKDTHVKKLGKALRLPVVTTTELLETAIATGKYPDVKKTRDLGFQVEDEIMIPLVITELAKPEYQNGYILSGAPRSIKQWELLRDAGFLDAVIWLEITPDIYRSRARQRLKEDDEKLGYHRPDDEPDRVQERIKTYADKTAPVFEFLKKHDAQKIITVDSSIPGAENVFTHELLPKAKAWIDEWQRARTRSAGHTAASVGHVEASADHWNANVGKHLTHSPSTGESLEAKRKRTAQERPDAMELPNLEMLAGPAADADDVGLEASLRHLQDRRTDPEARGTVPFVDLVNPPNVGTLTHDPNTGAPTRKGGATELPEGIENYQKQGLTVYRLTDKNSGSSFEIIPERGNTVVSLKVRIRGKDREILYQPEDLSKSGGIPILYPFANRLRDGIIDWDMGQSLKGAEGIKEDANGHPYHGMVREIPWKIERLHPSNQNGVGISCSLDSRDNPVIEKHFGKTKITVTYVLKGSNLFIVADSNSEKPTSLAFHPWFRRATNTKLTLRAQKRWVSSHRLPLNQIPVNVKPGRFDFRLARELGVELLDEVYTGLALVDGWFTATLLYPDEAVEVLVHSDHHFAHHVLYMTTDAVCLEPQTSATNWPELVHHGIQEATPKPPGPFRATVVIAAASENPIARALRKTADLAGIFAELRQMGRLTSWFVGSIFAWAGYTAALGWTGNQVGTSETQRLTAQFFISKKHLRQTAIPSAA